MVFNVANWAFRSLMILALLRELIQRGEIWNIGERSGCVVTTPIGMIGILSTSVTRNAAMIFASANVASTSAKCAPMQIRGPAPNGKYAKRSGGGAGAMKRSGTKAFGSRQSFS